MLKGRGKVKKKGGKLRKIELRLRLSGSYDIWVINELCDDLEYVQIIKTINNNRNTHTIAR